MRPIGVAMVKSTGNGSDGISAEWLHVDVQIRNGQLQNLFSNCCTLTHKQMFFSRCWRIQLIWKLTVVNICSCSRSSTGSATTWPRSTWTAWKSDSTNPWHLALQRAEGAHPGPRVLDLCSCLLSPCIQLWLSPSPCLNETPSAIKTDQESSTGQLVTYYWHPFCFPPSALCSDLYSLCATLHLPKPEDT